MLMKPPTPPPRMRGTTARPRAAAAARPPPRAAPQPQNRRTAPQPRAPLAVKRADVVVGDRTRAPLAVKKTDVVVGDRTRHTTYRRELGDGLTLGGSWAAKEAKLLELAQANETLQQRCSVAEARAEPANAQAERLRLRSAVRTAQEVAGMAEEDARVAHFAKFVARHQIMIANECTDACSTRLAKTAALLIHSEREVVELLKAITALGTKCQRLEKLWETERKSRDVLDHAKTQKEKHVCVLLKERDRLEREVKALRRKAESPRTRTPEKTLRSQVSPTCVTVTPDLPSPLKMAALSPSPRPSTPSPQQSALDLLEGENTPVRPGRRVGRPGRALDVQAALLRKYKTRDLAREQELAKLQQQLKTAEAKNKELQVRYGNRPEARRARTPVY